MQKAVSFTGVHSTKSILLAGLFVMIGISSLEFAHAQSPIYMGVTKDGCYDKPCGMEPMPNYSRTCDCDRSSCILVLCPWEPEPEPLELSDSILGALLIAAVFGGVAAASFIRGKRGRYVPSPLLLFGIAVIMITICFILFEQTCVTTLDKINPQICLDTEFPLEHILDCAIRKVETCTSAWHDLSQFLVTPFK